MVQCCASLVPRSRTICPARHWHSDLRVLRLNFAQAPIARARHAAWSALDADGRSSVSATLRAPRDCWQCPVSLVSVKAGRQRATTISSAISLHFGLAACNQRLCGRTQLTTYGAGDAYRGLESDYLEAAAIGEVSEPRPSPPALLPVATTLQLAVPSPPLRRLAKPWRRSSV